MAEMNFFFTIKERDEFVEFCFDNNFKIIPDLHYDDDAYYKVKTVRHYRESMGECIGFYLIHDNYSLYPLEMDFFERDNKKLYYIMQRYGGPSIDFYTPFFAEKKDSKVGPGLISIYPFYYHNNKKFVPNNEFRMAYQMLLSYIRKRAKRVKISKRAYWVGNYAIEQVKIGKLEFVEMEGFDWGSIL